MEKNSTPIQQVAVHACPWRLTDFRCFTMKSSHLMVIITVLFIASPWLARQPCFHNIKAGCFQTVEEMSKICLSGMGALNSGALVNANWTFGPYSFSSSAFHSILALKAVNTVIHVRTSPSNFVTRTEEHIPVSFFELGDVKIEAETSLHWKLHGSYSWSWR